MGFLAAVVVFVYLVFVVVVAGLPVFIIVRYRKNKQEMEAKRAAQLEVKQNVETQPTVQAEIEKKIAALDKKIYTEIEKDEPDMAVLKKWQEEIKKLKIEQEKAILQVEVQATQAMPQVVVASAPAEKSYAGMNTLLYMGALLIVAGVGSLMMALVEDSTRLIIVLLMMVIFYGAGLAVRTNQKLRPAGNALTGTGLAIIPFLGLALAEFTGMPGEMAWLLTSVVGVVAYVVAAYAMGSKVVSYLALAFLISTVCSFSATLSLPMIWYFILVMVLGVILAVVRVALHGNTSRLGVMSEVVNASGRYLTLLTAVASWMVVWDTDIWFYVAVYAVVAAQALVAWWYSRSLIDEVIMRFSLQAATSTLVLAVYQGNLAGTGYGLMIIALVQALASLFITMLGVGRVEKRSETEQGIMLVSMIVIACGVIPMLLDLQMVLGMALMVSWTMIGVLAVLAVLVHNNTAWLLGLLCSLIAVPLALGSLVLKASNGWYTVVYGLELILVAVGLIWVALKEVELKMIGEVMLTTLGITTLCTLVSQEEVVAYMIFSVVVWLWAAAMGIYGWLRQQKWAIEAAIYGGVVGLDSLLGNVIFHGVSSSDGILFWVKVMLILHVSVGGLVGVSIWREHGEEKPLRLALAAISLTAVLGNLAIATTGSYYTDVGMGLLWQLTFLLEEVALLIVGVIVKQGVIWKTGAVGVILAVMWFTKEIAWIWLILIGLGLLVFSIWRLARK